MILSLLPLFVPSIILINAETIAADNQQISSSAHFRLTPPLGKKIKMVKKQTHCIGTAQIIRTTEQSILFTPTTDKNSIGFDINVELISSRNEGDAKLAAILSKTNQKIGSISHYSYDVANDILTLKNSDQIWENLMMNLSSIQSNAGERNAEQKITDQKFLDRIKNTPTATRKAILSEDMAIILSFIGKHIILYRQNHS